MELRRDSSNLHLVFSRPTFRFARRHSLELLGEDVRMRILLAALMATFVASPARAAVILYDGFDYTVEQRIIGQVNPITSTPWIDPSSPAQPETAAGNGTADIDPQVIVSGSVGYSGLATSTGHSLAIPRGIPRPTSGTPNIGTHANIARIVMPTKNVGNTVDGKLYYSFTLQQDNIFIETDANARADYALGGFLAGFHAGPLSPTSQTGMQTAGTYGGQIRIRRQLDFSIDPLGLQTDKFEFGLVKNNAAGASTVVEWDETQAFDINSGPILVVGSYHFIGNTIAGETDDEVKLWLNPTPGETEGAATLASTEGTDPQISSFYNLRSFWLRSDRAFPGDFIIDELRIGDTFADVTPAGPAGVDGDFNVDGAVDGTDILLWQRGESPNGLEVGDLQLWMDNFGTGAGAAAFASVIPEPATGVLATIAALSAAWARLRVKT
jgi:hypothetical protein